MEKQFYDFSWQAVGISSNPNIKRDPISLHMQNYLKWGSQHSRRHLVVVDDFLQTVNYNNIYGFDFHDSYAEVFQKGQKKLQDLEVVARANNLSNIGLMSVSELRDVSTPLEKEIYNLYCLETEIRKAIQSCLPRRFAGASESKIDSLAYYAIRELAFTLSLGGARISHKKESQVFINNLAMKLYDDFGIGKKIEFVYPIELGLEYEIGLNGTIEPYSAGYNDERLLLSDSAVRIFHKCTRASPQRRRRLSRWLERTTGTKLHPIRRLYHEHIKTGRQSLIKDDLKRIARNVIGYSLTAAFASAWIAINTTVTLEMNKNPEALKSFAEMAKQKYK